MKRTIDVVAAVIVKEDLELYVQRGPGGSLPGLWEFPGGKIESGETPQQALAREITEELKFKVAVGEKVTTTIHEYDFGIVNLSTFYCELVEGTPQLVEHSQLVWSDPKDLRELEWAPADLPAVNLISQHLSS